jgi:conjugative transfer signal peptidase TraF
MRRQVRQALIILGVGVALVASIGAAGVWGGYRLNMTRSYPLGLWRIEASARGYRAGDVVFICPPSGEAFDLARERGYLPRGLCPGGTGPLIKEIVAVAGQMVSIGGSVTIDGVALADSIVGQHDVEGRALPPAAGGVVPAGYVFLHSAFSGSFDSRYFGPVPASGILGLARPVFTLAP